MLKPIVYPEVRLGLYLISENGEIFSNYKQDFLSPSEDKDGYLKVGLYRNEDKKQKTIRVATLVAYHFINPPTNLKDPTVNHKDNNIKNNCYSNLEWMERSKNSSIRRNKGDGELNHEAKLTLNQVKEIRQKYFPGFGYDNLAKEYNVSKGCIADIIKNRTWQNTREK